MRRGLDDAVFIHVDGEAGLGKSRLLDELDAAPRRRPDRACELLRARAAPALRADCRCAASGVRRRRARRPASGRRSGRSFPSSHPDTAGRRFDEVEVLEALVALVAEHGPVVLVLDDLHWADTSTLAALAYLRRRGAGLGVALVTTALPPDTVVRGLSSGGWRRTRSCGSSRSRRRSSRRSGMPDLHEATGGHPACGRRRRRGRPARESFADAGGGAARPVPSRGAARRTGSSPPPPCSSSHSTPSRSQSSSTPTRPRSRRSSSASANGGSCASTGSDSASATTSSVRCCARPISPARQRLLQQRLDHQHVAIGFGTESQAG